MPDEKNLWKNRYPLFLELFSRYHWDFGGLQEVTSNQLNDIKFLSNYEFIGEKRSPEENSEYCPIFFNKNKFSCIEYDTFWLSDTPEKMSKTDSWDAGCYRIATWANLKDQQNEFYVINTHLDHLSEKARFKGIKVIKQFIEKHVTDYPVFLTGDFNGESSERFYQEINSVLNDSFVTARYKTGPRGTCTGVDFEPDFSWDCLEAIDYIFCSKTIFVEEINVRTDQIENQYPSDHFPVEIICKL